MRQGKMHNFARKKLFKTNSLLQSSTLNIEYLERFNF